MDATNKLFLSALKAALSNKKAELPDDVTAAQWQELFRMAGIHNVLPLFYEAVYTAPSLQTEQALLAPVKSQIRMLLALQTQRTTEFLELNRRLQAAGVRPLVVKGIICRELYPQPDHRPSSDEDVLIPADRFALCHQVLSDYGMQSEKTPDAAVEDYEVSYRKPGSPVFIELHKQLFPPASDAYGELNRFFEGVFDRAVAEQIQGDTVYTLSPTDHLLYLLCHAFKHFLHSGFGIRQVCDIVLYANRYGKRVDWQRILENCQAVRADKFAAALFRIGEKYLVFDLDQAAWPEAWRQLQVDEQPMLEDLLSGGLYGTAKTSRKHSSNITLDAVIAQKKGRKTKNAVLLSAFPPVAKLQSQYPYLKRHRYLLPIAWSSRFWEYIKETRRSRDSNAADSLKIGSERVALMKVYGILE